MRKLTIGERVITDNDVFVIAEIGSNHMGDADLCEKMIIEAAACGVDAVKLQKRDNEKMFTKSILNKSYDNELSYGKTYGEHREHLDWFGEKEFIRFKSVADKHGVLFFATPFEEASAEFLHDLGVPLWKIASCDVKNLPLVKKVAEYGQPMIISTGGADFDDIMKLVLEIHPINPNYALLHCISTYPNTDEVLNLDVIAMLRLCFFNQVIGFSSHHAGILPLMIARTLGASVFEMHFTLNRGFKGTDHGFSLEPQGLRQACIDLKRVKTMLGDGKKEVLPVEKDGFVKKMGKGVYAVRKISKGEEIKREDLTIKSPAGGILPSQIDEIVGKSLICELSTGVAIQEDMINGI